ncbi:MAG: Oxidoreductase, aldo/keto reductase family [uncultured Solirubrobacteraceae bacterium]|uniref:Oxidoreductase, aldo/keto reductase family n=1 Tax=uncultured Solirubrobacteraceae bacterium TaxID=1162706 RepID=A0A6J4RD01_9ACTN|nr:MAG: Oxidoreductase, aldo/keto reductase family [uncultured Solirubrobacteraceae bacterium]
MSTSSYPQVTFPDGEPVPALGQGTWYMGEDASARQQEVRALQEGIDLGMTLIDTAEMYASGGAERVTGEAIAGRRDDVFLVSKVLPYNAGYDDCLHACESSLARLGTDRLDLYLLHWRGGVPLEETLEAFERLLHEDKIGAWGVSNFDADDMTELLGLPGGDAVATDQVLYNLTRRWPEAHLLPGCRELGIPLMAYSPIEQGRMLRHPALLEVAGRHGATPAQVALAWLLEHDDVIVIPKAASLDHVRENRQALALDLTTDDLTTLDAGFPAPRGRPAMEML